MKTGALRRYREMRDFGETPEPRGEAVSPRTQLTYVIQRHDARRLHFDFRLELDGVLKSWAVPKGPSLVPGERRLAVEVEDHPLEYGRFEGAIPHGHYGAGHVLIWDQGIWTPDGDPHPALRKGRLSFTLEGKRLHGHFSLVRMRARDGGKNQWLLLKSRDSAAAGPDQEPVTEAAPVPALASFHVQLATPKTAPPKGASWMIEPKLEGERVLASVENGEVRIRSAAGKTVTKRYGAVGAALARLPIQSAVFDGTIGSVDAGYSIFSIFDLLFIDGFDVRDRPLETRKSMLESILHGQKAPLAYVTHVEGGQGKAALDLACQHGAQGIVAKRKDRPHRPARSRDWIEVACPVVRGRPANQNNENAAGETVVAGVRISHPDRVLDRVTGLTKGGLAMYYGAVAERLLPHIVRRPLALVRCPEGDQAECFFQKQRTPGMPASIHASRIAKHGILHVEDEPGLISLIQFGAVELHGWGSRLPERGPSRQSDEPSQSAEPDKPDCIVMDLDPDEGLPFSRVVEAALAMREALASIGLQSFVKTTGGKGLHVVVPIVPELAFDAIKEFTLAVATEFERSDPHRYTATLSKAARRGKIFIDYLRNGRGATAVVPYSVRARPGAPVAFPLAWRDLDKVDPRDFSVATVPKLLRQRRRDPWADFFAVEQRVPRASSNPTPRRSKERLSR